MAKSIEVRFRLIFDDDGAVEKLEILNSMDPSNLYKILSAIEPFVRQNLPETDITEET